MPSEAPLPRHPLRGHPLRGPPQGIRSEGPLLTHLSVLWLAAEFYGMSGFTHCGQFLGVLPVFNVVRALTEEELGGRASSLSSGLCSFTAGSVF